MIQIEASSSDPDPTLSEYSQSQAMLSDQDNTLSEVSPLCEALPPPPTPPISANHPRINLQITKEIPEENLHPKNVITSPSTTEEPKYARVELKNKRNSKQIGNGNNLSQIEEPSEGASNE